MLGRSSKAVELLNEMRSNKILELEDVSIDQALDMHGHMLDFKKRGSFIRNSWRKVEPNYGYKPKEIPVSRKIVEGCLGIIFGFAKMPLAHFIVEHLPLSIVGPSFNTLRKTWRGISKPTKRKGLREIEFVETEDCATSCRS